MDACGLSKGNRVCPGSSGPILDFGGRLAGHGNRCSGSILRFERILEHLPEAYFLLYLSHWGVIEPLSFDRPVYVAGSETHGIWASPRLEHVAGPIDLEALVRAPLATPGR